jgi:hypothetical protein
MGATPSSKRCVKCDSLGPFQRDRTKKNGLSCRCKVCLRAYTNMNWDRRIAATRAWAAANPERYNASKRAWYTTHRNEILAHGAARYTGAERAAFARDYTSRKRAFIESMKRGKKCVDCLRSYPPVCMDFDHVWGSEVAPVSQMVSCSDDTILAEIAKCDLVRANYHRTRTEARRERSLNPYRVALRVRLEALKSGPCQDCGGVFPVPAMEFDHVGGSKATDVSRLWSWGRILKEVAKCDLVCSCCRRLRAHMRRETQKVA